MIDLTVTIIWLDIEDGGKVFKDITRLCELDKIDTRHAEKQN